GFDYCQMLYQDLERLQARQEAHFSWETQAQIEEVERELESVNRTLAALSHKVRLPAGAARHAVPACRRGGAPHTQQSALAPRWCNGSHASFRSWCPEGRAGSSPALGTAPGRGPVPRLRARVPLLQLAPGLAQVAAGVQRQQDQRRPERPHQGGERER